ncbi:unnamed protein product [Moneuplotes crassus]|uniref:Uncharacterized protein n=1 Tax=Euplotes crassus TaxID=5936 RepID=A0AAD1YAE3_EUPCR|nr:unnamed protein product [Moneuplotes crassus]
MPSPLCFDSIPIFKNLGFETEIRSDSSPKEWIEACLLLNSGDCFSSAYPKNFGSSSSAFLLFFCVVGFLFSSCCFFSSFRLFLGDTWRSSLSELTAIFGSSGTMLIRWVSSAYFFFSFDISWGSIKLYFSSSCKIQGE